MLHFAIKGKYGHLRLSPEQFREKESQGTLTDKEREEYFEPGPFSVVTYLEQLSRPGFYDVEDLDHHHQWADLETHKDPSQKSCYEGRYSTCALQQCTLYSSL